MCLGFRVLGLGLYRVCEIFYVKPRYLKSLRHLDENLAVQGVLYSRGFDDDYVVERLWSR